MNKIVFVIGLTKSGGAEKRAILIARLLKERFETRVFAFAGEKVDGVDQVFRNTYSDYKKESPRKRIEALRRYLDEEKPDFVFSFLPHVNMLTTLSLRAKRFSSIVHVVALAFHRYDFKNRLFLRYSIKHADAVYYQCADQRTFVPCKCPSFVLSNPMPAQDEHSYKNDYSFMSVGRLESQKDFDLMIRCFAGISKVYPQASLDIYGSGSLRATLEELVQSLHLTDQIRLHPYTEDIASAYQAHDVFLFTTKYEGFPNALAEAMSHGLICFTTDFSTGRADLIEDQKTGFLCPSREVSDYVSTVTEGLSDYNKAIRIGKNGRAHILKRCDTARFIQTISDELLSIKASKS